MCRTLGHVGILDPTRRIGDVWVLHADAGAEQLETTARTGRLDDRRLELGILAGKLFGYSRGERINGGRTNRTDLGSRLGRTGADALACGDRKSTRLNSSH